MPETEIQENTAEEKSASGEAVLNENSKSVPVEASAPTAISDDTQVYELGYLLLPTIPEENVPAVFGNLKELISSQDGEIISSEMPRMMRLAYVMEKTINNKKNKFDTAYFGWIKFGIESEKIEEIKKELDGSPDIIRFLIIKTVRENTMAPKKLGGNGMNRYRAMKEAREKEEKESSEPMDKEKVDKEIEALVSEEA